MLTDKNLEELANGRLHGRAKIDRAHAARTAELYREEYVKLVNYLAARTRDWTEARDIASEAFVQTLETCDPAVTHLKAYVYKAAINIALNRGKAREVRRRLEQVVSAEMTANPPASPEPAVLDEQQIDVEQTQLKLMQEAIGRLPPRCRLALELRIWDGMSYSQVLEHFARQGIIVNERTIRRWIAHGLEFCRQEILKAEALAAEAWKKETRK